MSGRRRQRGRVAALVVAALCSVTPLLTHAPTATGSTLAPAGGGIGVPGVPLTLTAGGIGLVTGLAIADLSNGANGRVSLAVGPCLPVAGTPCSGVLSEIWLTGNFKDADGNPLYSDSAPASVSWTCNALVCPAPADFVPGTSTLTEMQVEEYLNHTMYVSLRNPDGTYQPFAPAPACNGIDGAPLPTGTINPQETGGVEFCVDVGAISRANAQCQTTCSAWSGPLTLPMLFVEDPRWLGS